MLGKLPKGHTQHAVCPLAGASSSSNVSPQNKCPSTVGSGFKRCTSVKLLISPKTLMGHPRYISRRRLTWSNTDGGIAFQVSMLLSISSLCFPHLPSPDWHSCSCSCILLCHATARDSRSSTQPHGHLHVSPGAAHGGFGVQCFADDAASALGATPDGVRIPSSTISYLRSLEPTFPNSHLCRFCFRLPFGNQPAGYFGPRHALTKRPAALNNQPRSVQPFCNWPRWSVPLGTRGRPLVRSQPGGTDPREGFSGRSWLAG